MKPPTRLLVGTMHCIFQIRLSKVQLTLSKFAAKARNFGFKEVVTSNHANMFHADRALWILTLQRVVERLGGGHKRGFIGDCQSEDPDSFVVRQHERLRTRWDINHISE